MRWMLALVAIPLAYYGSYMALSTLYHALKGASDRNPKGPQI